MKKLLLLVLMAMFAINVNATIETKEVSKTEVTATVNSLTAVFKMEFFRPLCEGYRWEVYPDGEGNYLLRENHMGAGSLISWVHIYAGNGNSARENAQYICDNYNWQSYGSDGSCYDGEDMGNN